MSSSTQVPTGFIVRTLRFSPSQTAAQLKKVLATSIRQKLEEDNINISTFARRIKTGRISIRRLLDPKNTAITLRTMAKATHALGLDVTINIRPRPLAELTPIAEHYVATRDEAEAARLEEQLIAGYYGRRIKAPAKVATIELTKRPVIKLSRGRTRHAKSPAGQHSSRFIPASAAAS